MILCILRSDFSFYQTETWNQFHTPCKSVHVPIISFLTTPARTVSKCFQFYELKSVFICLLVGTSFVTSEMKYFHAYFPFRFSLFVIWLFELCLAFPQISKRSSWFEIIYPSLSIQFEDSYSTDHSVLVTARTKSVYFVDLAEERRFPLGHRVSDVERLKTPSIQIPHFNEWMLGYGLVYSWEYFPSRMAYPIYIFCYIRTWCIFYQILYTILYIKHSSVLWHFYPTMHLEDILDPFRQSWFFTVAPLHPITRIKNGSLTIFPVLGCLCYSQFWFTLML